MPMPMPEREQRQRIDNHEGAATLAIRQREFIAARQRTHQQHRVLEANARLADDRPIHVIGLA